MSDILLLLLVVPVGLGAGVWFAVFAPAEGPAREAGVLVAGLSEASPVLAGLAVVALGLGVDQVGALACAWALLLVPRLVRSVGRALEDVDPRLRIRAEGLGATTWEALRTLVLPAAAPRLTGLAVRDVARTLGELAPLVLLAGASQGKILVAPWIAAAALAGVLGANLLATSLERAR